jgi:hypothetical protein
MRKRIYRPLRDPYIVPVETIDLWIIFVGAFALLVYLAWRYT